MTRASRLTTQILIGMSCGIAAGYLCHRLPSTPERVAQLAGYFSLITELFLRLVKMLIAPLVFSTLVTGVAQMGSGTSLGKTTLRSMSWFIAAGLVSLSLGLVMVHVLQPGAGMSLSIAEAVQVPGSPTADLSLRTFITHLVPRSIFESLADNEILQIVVFSLLAGVALAALGEKGSPLMRGIDALASLMLQITHYVMRLAPVAVFAALAGSITTHGLGILLTFGKFVGGFYLSLAILWMLLAAAAYVVLGRSTGILLRGIRDPVLLAFATASSEAAYPKTLEVLDRMGIPKRVASFVLPLGYSFNMDGSMMFCAFALMFIAQAFGIDLSFGQQITMLLLLMVTSKGTAGVPRASLVIVAAALPQFGLPEQGLFLILGIDQFLDMGRTATNVLGNSIATAVVSKWDGVTLRRPVESNIEATAASVANDPHIRSENAGFASAHPRGPD